MKKANFNLFRLDLWPPFLRKYGRYGLGLCLLMLASTVHAGHKADEPVSASVNTDQSVAQSQPIAQNQPLAQRRPAAQSRHDLQNEPVIRYFGDPDRNWSLYTSYAPDDEAGPDRYPNRDYNFITQYSMRISPVENGYLTGINLFLDDFRPGGFGLETVGYYQDVVAFDWPFPFNHVPQLFLGHAVRFSAPDEGGSLQKIRFYSGPGTVVSGGTQAVVRMEFRQPELSDVFYYDPSMGIGFTFNTPVDGGADGNDRTGYGVRFTAPEGEEGSLIRALDVYVTAFNQFMPGADNPPDDELRVRLYQTGEDDLPEGEPLGEVRVSMLDLETEQFNRIDLLDAGVYVEAGTDVFAALDLVKVGNQDRIGFAGTPSLPTPIERSLLKENGEWVSIANSASFGSGPGAGSELWMHMHFESGPVVEQGSEMAVVERPLTDFSASQWTDIDLSDESLPQLEPGEDLWVAVTLHDAGENDLLSMVTGDAESDPRYRFAALVQQETDVWKYLADTQFDNDYAFRMEAVFATGTADLTDNLILALYSNDQDSLPGSFLNFHTAPLASLTEGEWNYFDVSEWEYMMETGRDFHIAVTSQIEDAADGFALRSDAGRAGEEKRAGAFYENTTGWTLLADREGYANYQFLMEVFYTRETSARDDIAGRFALHPNYPNPFNPSTIIAFELPVEQQVVLEIYDLLGNRVSTLVDRHMAAGFHRVTFDADGLASGTYICRLRAGEFVQSQTMMLVR